MFNKYFVKCAIPILCKVIALESQFYDQHNYFQNTYRTLEPTFKNTYRISRIYFTLDDI